MKVLHLMNDLRASGMERMFISAADHFAGQQVESIIVGQGTEHPFRADLEAAGYTVLETPKVKSKAGALAFIKLLREVRPNVIHLHSEGSYSAAVILAKIALPKTPIVRTIHNVFEPSGIRGKLRTAEYFTVDKLVHALVAVAPDVQNHEARLGRKTRLIYNWVDDRFYSLRSTEKVRAESGRASVVIVGNSSPIKNHQLVLEAILDLPLDLYFHGDERDANDREREILDQLQAQGRLRYRGLGDPGQSLLHGSVYVMPSTKEGMGVALAEALVVGIPAIIADAPGLRWAQQFPNVQALPLDKDKWREALAKHDNGKTGHNDNLPVNLGAAAGAENYTRLYGEAIDVAAGVPLE